MNITIKEFTNREIIYCVSPLIYHLTQENKLEEELALSLWEGKIDYEIVEEELNKTGEELTQEDGYWGIYDNNVCYWIIDPLHKTKEEAIDDYFNNDLEDYRAEVFEHWIVSNWLATKLLEHEETVIEVYGLTVWSRTTTGQAIWCDYVIQEIYEEINKKN